MLLLNRIIQVDSKYIYQSSNYDDNCCKTSTAMLASINSDGKDTADGTGKIGDYIRENHYGISDYEVRKKGFHNYKNLSEEDINTIIKGEIDSGNVVMLHTQYAKNEHWVIVSSYTLNENDSIELLDENGRKYITGLGGIDPEEQHNPDVPQRTDNLGKKATVDSSGGQWLHPDGTIRTYNP